MAATQCSLSHAGCSHGAHVTYTPARARTTRAFFSPRDGQLSVCRHFLSRNPAVPSSHRRPHPKTPAEADRSHGICACHGAPPPSSTRSSHVLTSLVIAIAIPVVSGTVASIFNGANVDWYKSLRKPAWNPPTWLFGAAWSLLYGVMGFASWLVWVQGGWEVQGDALSLYALQLVLNLAWPALFFGAKHMVLALVDILGLWVSLFACIRAFEGVNPLAARLLYPYLAWVTFASALNYSYWKLNAA